MSRARGFWPVYHPAGLDDELRTALEELEAGRWLGMRNLLARTGAHWGLRTARTQVLAAAAARSTVIQEWESEEPGSVDVAVMRARVLVERALRADRLQAPGTWQVAQEARAACEAAAHCAPADPVPWVCMLAVAQLDPRQALEENRWLPAEPTLPPGPWRLLHGADERDLHNREAYHRLLAFLYVRQGGSLGEAVDYGRWVGSWAPEGTALRVLPLYVYARSYWYRRQRGDDLLARQEWTKEHILRDTMRALRGWFDYPVPKLSGTWSVLDLSHLAHALWAAHHFQDAARVFDAMGPYATHLPWRYVSDVPDKWPEEFVRARTQCMSYARNHPPSA